MFPDLLDLGFLHLKTYGACMAVGFLLCWNLVERFSGRKDLSNLLLSLMIAGVVGSRAAYVIEHWSSEFAAAPWSVVRVDQGGLMFYGGLILALVVFGAWCAVRRENPLVLADLLATVIPLGHACGRIGCFFYGCCYGRLSDSPLAVSFPSHSPAWYEQFHAGLIPATAARAMPVLPTQLFEAAALLVLFAVLLFVRRRKDAPGLVTGVYLAGYAALRFVLEYLRGDPRAAIGPFSISQTISLGLLVLGVGLVSAGRLRLRTGRANLRVAAAAALVACGAFAEHQPYSRYERIVERQMFGELPDGFDPTKPPGEAVTSRAAQKAEQELMREQQKIRSAIHFSMINVTPAGETAVGFTDSSDPKAPFNYYLKVGESRNGWTVREADAGKGSMTIVRDGIEVSLMLGENSAKGGGRTSAAASAAYAPAVRTGASGSPTGPAPDSLRGRRSHRQDELQADFLKKLAERDAAEAKRREEDRQMREAKEAEDKAERADLKARLLDLMDQNRRDREGQPKPEQGDGAPARQEPNQ